MPTDPDPTPRVDAEALCEALRDAGLTVFELLVQRIACERDERETEALWLLDRLTEHRVGLGLNPEQRETLYELVDRYDAIRASYREAARHREVKT